MNEIYLIAKLGNAILIVNKADLAYIDKERAFEVKCIVVDLAERTIDPPEGLEKHLKFNPWEEITNPDERMVLLQVLNNKFSDAEILQKILQPLAENAVSLKSS